MILRLRQCKAKVRRYSKDRAKVERCYGSRRGDGGMAEYEACRLERTKAEIKRGVKPRADVDWYVVNLTDPGLYRVQDADLPYHPQSVGWILVDSTGAGWDLPNAVADKLRRAGADVIDQCARDPSRLPLVCQYQDGPELRIGWGKAWQGDHVPEVFGVHSIDLSARAIRVERLDPEDHRPVLKYRTWKIREGECVVAVNGRVAWYRAGSESVRECDLATALEWAGVPAESRYGDWRFDCGDCPA